MKLLCENIETCGIRAENLIPISNNYKQELPT